MAPAARLAAWSGLERWSRRLSDRVGESQQVVAGRAEQVGVGGKPEDLPAPRRTEPLTVRLTQVVRMRLREDGQRSQHGRLVGVDVG